MKFRTETDIKSFGRKIGYENRILTLGSCFADNMAGMMRRAKFDIVANPVGVLFNPASIVTAVRLFDNGAVVRAEELTESGGRFFDYRFHGSLTGFSPEEALRNMNGAIGSGHKALHGCDTVIITFGTAWVYVLNSTGMTVANCHKQPSALFTRRRMSVDEIVELFSGVLETSFRDKHVIFTISPVRHLGDGADENFLSKATLKLAVAELVAKHDNADYFPSYEIMNDDLRDYRFYADDLVHPSTQAIAYIREKFFDAALSDEAKSLLPRIEKIVAASEHRPFCESGDAYRTFCRRMLDDIETLRNGCPTVDFTAEENYFKTKLQ